MQFALATSHEVYVDSVLFTLGSYYTGDIDDLQDVGNYYIVESEQNGYYGQLDATFDFATTENIDYFEFYFDSLDCISDQMTVYILYLVGETTYLHSLGQLDEDDSPFHIEISVSNVIGFRVFKSFLWDYEFYISMDYAYGTWET